MGFNGKHCTAGIQLQRPGSARATGRVQHVASKQGGTETDNTGRTYADIFGAYGVIRAARKSTSLPRLRDRGKRSHAEVAGLGCRDGSVAQQGKGKSACRGCGARALVGSVYTQGRWPQGLQGLGLQKTRH